MEIEKYHVVGLRPNAVAAMSDEALQANIAFNPSLKSLCGHRFANWMQTVWAHEYERRQSGGLIEMCSFEMPLLLPLELHRVRTWVTLQTYNHEPDAKLYDELLAALDTQTRYHIEKYQQLLEQQ
ncbi:MAG TPA: hypothetical protein DDZ51_05815 [Planctomycetaceae bacterium]|jgi:hypothetical protein|nr:hypothetical protein [Planctomycetaceae bacterium]